MKEITLDGIIGIQFHGKLPELEEAVKGLSHLTKKFGPDTVMIETAKFPESQGNLVSVRFKGNISQFENVNNALKDLKSSVAIETVPLPERQMIGTWPTPEIPKDSNIWYLTLT